MSKSKEELNALKEEVEAVNEKLQELTEEEIAQVNGGAEGAPRMGKESTAIELMVEIQFVLDSIIP